MLNSFHRTIITVTLGAIALTTGACGRISILPPAPPPPPETQFAPMPTELAAAVTSARAALADPEATLVYAAAYGVTPVGRLADSHRSGWVVGFQERRTTGPRASLVVIDWTARKRVLAAKPWSGQVPKLDAAKLPQLRQTVLWARDAGLKKADTFMVAYVASATGPVAAVTERDDDVQAAFDDDGGTRQIVMLDALTGKPLAKLAEPAPAPAAEPTEAEEEAAAPAEAASLAALVMGPRRGF